MDGWTAATLVLHRSGCNEDIHKDDKSTQTIVHHATIHAAGLQEHVRFWEQGKCAPHRWVKQEELEHGEPFFYRRSNNTLTLVDPEKTKTRHHDGAQFKVSRRTKAGPISNTRMQDLLRRSRF